MKQLQMENYGRKLRILQTDTRKASFTLHEIDDFSQSSPGKVVASMKFPSFWNEKAIVESDGKSWILQPKGWASGKRSIIDSATNAVIGEIRQFAFRDNELEIIGAGFYKMHRFNFFGTEWGILDQFGRTLVRFSPYGRGFRDFFKNQADIKLAQGVEKQSDIYLIIVSAWYLRIIEARQTAAAAGGS
jgi:hypothetical protein